VSTAFGQWRNRGVLIRYGYDIVGDRYIAHIVVPESQRAGAMQARVRSSMRCAFPGDKYTLDAASVEDLLDAMKEAIDEFLAA
jgi:hypothetical protein